MFHWICKWSYKPDELEVLPLVLKKKKIFTLKSDIMETNEMLHAGMFLNAYFSHLPMKKKMTFAIQALLWKVKPCHLFTKKKEHQEHLEKLSFLLSLFSHQVAVALASACLGWKQIDAPKTA